MLTTSERVLGVYVILGGVGLTVIFKVAVAEHVPLVALIV